MKVFIWATLLFSVTSSKADSGASLGRLDCSNNFCIRLTEDEITAEAGLCVVIPCYFTTSNNFKTQSLVWFKCEQSKPKCADSDIIFHSKNKNKVQSEFKDRVSLLESDVSQNNCSIIINDLKESDSGSYQLKVNGLFSGKQDGFTFSPRSSVSVKGLSEKPTVLVPALTEGHQTTLTCTAPGLCSGSVPEITWTWRPAGNITDSHITGNKTDSKTETLTAVAQRHSSTLTFNLSAEHHGTEVTCKVKFTGNMSTEETVTLNVTYVKEVQISGDTNVKEGETLTLTCSVESFPPSFVTWMKVSDENMQNRRETDLQDDTEAPNQSGTSTLSISNVTAEDSGQYICTVKHGNKILKKPADVTVTYVRRPEITGNPTVKMGDSLNLTCSVQSFPPTMITWTKPGADAAPQTNTGSVSLFIPKTTVEHSGLYHCTVKHLNTTLTLDVNVMLFPKILNDSGCVNQSNVLRCVCISEGGPSPTITWPLLKNHTEFSVTTTVSKVTVTSSISLTVADVDRSVECVSTNKNGEARQNFSIRQIVPAQPNKGETFLRVEIIVAFLIGCGLSAVVCCLAKQCHRTKQKTLRNPDETLEMVTSQPEPLIHDAAAVEDVQTDSLERVQNGVAPTDVEYASINLALLKGGRPREAAEESTKTEYSEIRRRRQTDREEEPVKEEDEETPPHCPTQEEEEEQVLEVYSSINHSMRET